MSSAPADSPFRLPHRLIFMLPAAIAGSVPYGRHHPCLHACILNVERGGRIVIEGPSRERVFEQATRFLRVVAKGHGRFSIAAVLTTPPPSRGRDGWQIIVGADVAFSPSEIEAQFPLESVG